MSLPYPATLLVESDWGSLVLLTPNARILPLDGHQYPPDVYFSQKQIYVGKGEKHYQTFKIPFVIHGSGQPIDIVTAHGDSSASGPQAGLVVVELSSGPLVNQGITGDGVNVKVFPLVPVPV